MLFLIQLIAEERTEVNSLLDISNFPWAECSPVENRVIYISDSLSLKRSKRNTGVVRWEFELSTIDMKIKVGRGIKAKLSAASDDTLLFVHPRLSFTQGVEPAAGIQSTGNNSVGSKTLSFTSAAAWQLMAGDIMQFSNDTKVYECAEDTLLQVGIQSVTLTNPLRNSVTDGTDVTVNNVAWHLVSDGVIDSSPMIASDDQDMELTLVAVEKL